MDTYSELVRLFICCQVRDCEQEVAMFAHFARLHADASQRVASPWGRISLATQVSFMVCYSFMYLFCFVYRSPPCGLTLVLVGFQVVVDALLASMHAGGKEVVITADTAAF